MRMLSIRNARRIANSIVLQVIKSISIQGCFNYVFDVFTEYFCFKSSKNINFFFKVIGLTTKQPKVKYFGNKRHYFAKPLEGEILARVKSLK